MTALFTLVLLNTYAQGAVWKAENTWDNEWQRSYSKWVNTSVGSDIFTNPKSPLYQMETDCADALYTLRVYFAYKNSLPIKFNRPYGTSLGEKVISNEMTNFDNIQNELKRVRRFIRYVNAESGTDTLANYDTYPVKIKSLAPGDIFVTKWRFLTKRAKHSYVLHSINRENGDQTLLWSDEPVKVRDLKVRVGSPQFTIKGRPWGYKRWKFARDYQTKNSELPAGSDYSEEQYTLLSKYGGRKLFKVIKGLLKD